MCVFGVQQHGTSLYYSYVSLICYNMSIIASLAHSSYVRRILDSYWHDTGHQTYGCMCEHVASTHTSRQHARPHVRKLAIVITHTRSVTTRYISMRDTIHIASY